MPAQQRVGRDDRHHLPQHPAAQTLPPHRPGLDHDIELEEGKTPPNLPQYRMSDLELKVTREKLEDLERRGFIRRSTSPCAAPILFASKKGTTELRIYINYRGLNKIIIKNRYPLLLINNLLYRPKKAR